MELHSVDGPMARTAADLALFLDAMCDTTPGVRRQPGYSFEHPPMQAGSASFAQQAAVPLPSPGNLRVAWSADLGGLLPPGLAEPHSVTLTLTPHRTTHHTRTR